MSTPGRNKILIYVIGYDIIHFCDRGFTSPEGAKFTSSKILNLHLFDDDDSGRRWAMSVKDKNFEIWCVSRFTLHAVLKGNKPDFHQSMTGKLSKPLFDTIKNLNANVQVLLLGFA